MGRKKWHKNKNNLRLLENNLRQQWKNYNDHPHPRTAAHRQQVLHGDHKAGVSDEPVPQPQDVFYWLHEHRATKQHEVETGHQVSQTEDADSCRPGDENEAQHQPEEVAEHKHFDHVEVTPGDRRGRGPKMGR